MIDENGNFKSAYDTPGVGFMWGVVACMTVFMLFVANDYEMVKRPTMAEFLQARVEYKEQVKLEAASLCNSMWQGQHQGRKVVPKNPIVY